MMRQLFSVALTLLLMGSAMNTSANWMPEPTDVVTVEVKVENIEPAHILKVPVVSDPKQRKKLDDRWAGGEWAFAGSCHGRICKYGVYVSADVQGKNRARVWTTLKLEFEGGRKCEVTKEFRVIKGESIKRKMKCRGTSAEFRLSY